MPATTEMSVRAWFDRDLSTYEILTGTTLEPNGYGQWMAEWERPWEAEPVWPDFIKTLILKGKYREILRVWDVGSGPGTLGLPLTQMIARHTKAQVSLTCVDISQEAIERVTHPSQTVILRHNVEVTGIVEQALIAQPDKQVDGVVLSFLANWIPPEETLKILLQLKQSLHPDGRILIRTCSHLNPAHIGFKNQALLHESVTKTANGTDEKVVTKHHSRFNKDMFFYTLPGLYHLFQSAGLRWVNGDYVSLRGSQNGWGGEFPEGVIAVAGK